MGIAITVLLLLPLPAAEVVAGAVPGRGGGKLEEQQQHWGGSGGSSNSSGSSGSTN